jgi:hypothetical protein
MARRHASAILRFDQPWGFDSFDIDLVFTGFSFGSYVIFPWRFKIEPGRVIHDHL